MSEFTLFITHQEIRTFVFTLKYDTLTIAYSFTVSDISKFKAFIENALSNRLSSFESHNIDEHVHLFIEFMPGRTNTLTFVTFIGSDEIQNISEYPIKSSREAFEQLHRVLCIRHYLTFNT